MKPTDFHNSLLEITSLLIKWQTLLCLLLQKSLRFTSVNKHTSWWQTHKRPNAFSYVEVSKILLCLYVACFAQAYQSQLSVYSHETPTARYISSIALPSCPRDNLHRQCLPPFVTRCVQKVGRPKPSFRTRMLRGLNCTIRLYKVEGIKLINATLGVP